MRHNFPPLNALKVFEVAARHLSFSKAAEELFVTQGAVSKQIQTLEQYLEQPLFHREKGGLHLTDAGKLYLPTISEAMESIQSATALIKQSVADSNALLINTTPSFSTLWLIPKLEKIKEQFPDLTFQVTSTHSDNILSTESDLIIRCLPISSSQDPDSLLVEEELVAVISQERFKSSPVNTAADILNHPLILHTTRPQLWTSFLNHYIAEEYASPQFSDGYEHFFMSMEAVKRGQGIGLLPSFLAADLIDKGELVNLMQIKFMSGYGYYYSVPIHKRGNTKVVELAQCLKAMLTDS
ncbi:LysR family transcriptional regulator [Neptuniibacter caesariensis]|uniref:Putative transcriptional regulator, LysR family protein n=1 Tax=Neptuniibacter caesariensis TaxID=207954 RepID=A0A7U8GRI9_NEPCE|nr:LysR family transcriptional regulator [Neptuniibacter caesariensis]EAR60298.1 putative transcriptional regulator, LysR family protein [Oceanospirillum sp. MED92] [Neptuniibacter caesariensis]